MKESCYFCNNKLFLDNQCQHCKSIKLVTEKINSNFDIQSSDKFELLLTLLHSKTNIHKDILSNLICLNFISKIMNVFVEYYNNSPIFYISEDLSIKDNYQQIPEFIFASYPLYDTNYQVLNNFIKKDDKPLLFSNSNSKYHSILHLCEMNHIYFIEILLQFVDDLIIPYDISLLNEKELERLTLSLEIERNTYCTYNLDKYSYCVLPILDLSYFTTNINQDIELNIKNMTTYYDLLISQSLNKHQKIFERALVEKELNGF